MPNSKDLIIAASIKDGWLDLLTVATLCKISRQGVQKILHKNGYPPDKVKEIPWDCRSGRKRLIHISALPVEAQALYWKERTDPVGASLDILIQQQTEEPISDLALAWAKANPKEQRKALHKVKAVEEFNKLTTKAEKLAWAKHNHLSPASLYRWCAKYSGNPAELLRVFGLKKGTHGVSTPIQEDLVAFYCQKQKPSGVMVHRALKAKYGDQTPSKATLYRMLHDEALIPPSFAHFARKGEKAYRDKFEHVVRRDWTKIPVNHTWIGDHHPLDCRVITPRRTLARPSITSWEDGHSRVITGWSMSLQPNTQEIVKALRHGIMRKDDCPAYGCPTQCYMDNGRDFRSKALNGETIPVFRIDETHPCMGVFGMLNIGTRFAQPYHGKSKPVERVFFTLEAEYVSQLPGYTGNKPQERPDHLESDEIATLLWLKSDGAAGEKRLLWWWELEEELTDIVYNYNNSPHSALAMKTPNEVWAAEAPAVMPEANQDTLDLFTLIPVKRKISPSGITITYASRPHESVLYWCNGLLGLEGQTIEAWCDPSNRDEILVLTGKSTLRAQRKEAVTPFARTDEEIQALEEHLAVTAHQRKEYRERVRALRLESPFLTCRPPTRPLPGRPERKTMRIITHYDRHAKEAKEATYAQTIAVGKLQAGELALFRSQLENRDGERRGA